MGGARTHQDGGKVSAIFGGVTWCRGISNIGCRQVHERGQVVVCHAPKKVQQLAHKVLRDARTAAMSAMHVSLLPTLAPACPVKLKQSEAAVSQAPGAMHAQLPCQHRSPTLAHTAPKAKQLQGPCQINIKESTCEYIAVLQTPPNQMG